MAEGKTREGVRALTQAARAGNAQAALELGDYYNNNRDMIEATRWYNEAARLGGPEIKSLIERRRDALKRG
jgi:TPR repeat protein